jgi:hypothetical protein
MNFESGQSVCKAYKCTDSPRMAALKLMSNEVSAQIQTENSGDLHSRHEGHQISVEADVPVLKRPSVVKPRGPDDNHRSTDDHDQRKQQYAKPIPRPNAVDREGHSTRSFLTRHWGLRVVCVYTAFIRRQLVNGLKKAPRGGRTGFAPRLQTARIGLSEA